MQRSFTSLEVKKLCLLHPELQNPIDIIKMRANVFLDQFFKEFGEAYPINMEHLASMAGIKVRYVPLQESGFLCEEEGQLVAWINEQHPPQRQRFTIGHEITHTFFPGYVRKKVIFRSERIERNVNDESWDGDVEFLCNVGASELLMPTRKMKELLGLEEIRMDKYQNISDFFHASTEATLKKMVECSSEPVALVVCRSLIEDPDVLGFNYLTESKDCIIPFIEKHTIIPPNSFMYNLQPSDMVSMLHNTPVTIGGFSGCFNVETFCQLYQDKGRTIKKIFCLLHLGRSS